jgi:hypothetical protein
MPIDYGGGLIFPLRRDEPEPSDLEERAMEELYDGRDGSIEVPDDERCPECGADWCEGH